MKKNYKLNNNNNLFLCFEEVVTKRNIKHLLIPAGME